MKNAKQTMPKVNGHIEREHKDKLAKLATPRYGEFEHIRRALDDYFKRPDIRKLLEVK